MSPISDACASGARDTVLAIDTTAGACSVALLHGAGRVHRSAAMTQGHSRYVLGLVDEVLAEAGLTPASVDAIGFGAGPGSFTGLRIACGIAQGLGFGWGRPLVPVDAMRTLALQAALAAPPAVDWIWVALDLRMGEVCCAAFRRTDVATGASWPTPAVGPTLRTPAAALAAFEALGAAMPALAGDGWTVHAALGAAVPDGATRPATAVQPDAAAVACLARAGVREGRAVDAMFAAPTYLRDKVALDVHEQAASRAARAAGALR
jgi:tRNA threonylcarbamoyladenosine biosynthesis protein TsaB